MDPFCTYYAKIHEHIIYSHAQNLHPKIDFHLHEGFELYFLISGDINYFVEKNIYPVQYGDLMITNNREIHKPSFLSDALYERICLEFNPAMVRAFNSDDFDLLHCFTGRPNGEQNKMTLNASQIETLLDFFHKIENLQSRPAPGSEILKLSYLMELLVFINRIFLNIISDKELTNTPKKLIPVLEYIDANLERDLRLETLEKMFYMDRFNLSKLFKKSTGSSIHNYIIYKRISKAKLLLSQGWNVTDTCIRCGFNDYAHFLRMFKKAVGVSPGQYKKQYAQKQT